MFYSLQSLANVNEWSNYNKVSHWIKLRKQCLNVAKK